MEVVSSLVRCDVDKGDALTIQPYVKIKTVEGWDDDVDDDDVDVDDDDVKKEEDDEEWIRIMEGVVFTKNSFIKTHHIIFIPSSSYHHIIIIYPL